jgi:hypothetical protein
MLYQFMEKTTLIPKDFFETREGVCKVMPELTSKIIPLIGNLEHGINRIVKEFGSYFKTRNVRAYPDDRKPWKSTKKTETKTELPLFPLPDESTETVRLEMPENEWSSMSLDSKAEMPLLDSQ